MTTTMDDEEPIEVYTARLNEAARKVMENIDGDETKNPDYVEGFEDGYFEAVHALPQSCDVFLPFSGMAEDSHVYPRGFGAAVKALGCELIGEGDEYDEKPFPPETPEELEARVKEREECFAEREAKH